MNHYVKTAKKIKKSLGIKISHQSVRNWIVEYAKDQNIEINEEKSLIKNKSSPYSGYYVYDEEYLKINSKKHYRLILYDHINNIPVGEQIVPNLKSKTITEFIETITEGQKLISITTDLNPAYNKIMKKLKVKHQLCHFHLMKNINDIIRINNFKRKLTKEQYTFLKEKSKELKQIFNNTSIDEIKQTINKFNKLSDYLPKEFIKITTNHLKKNLYKYLEYITDYNIPKTSNNMENYYRQTDPEHIKKIYNE